MLSQLSKGYGSWTAGYVDPYFGAKKAHEHHELSFPDIEHESHIHGITIGNRSGRSTAMSWVHQKRSREPTLDGIPLPKTYTTRKGALQLYIGPDDLDDDDDEGDDEQKESGYALKPKYVEIKRPHGQELINLSLKLGTMERLAMSVLQFGDQDYDHEHTSVSDAKNKAFLKFLHKVDEGFSTTDIDSNVQPGGDLNNYLRDLKSSASNNSSNMRVSKSRESLELQAILRGLDNTGNWPLSYSQDGASDKQSIGQFTRPVSRVSSRGASPGPPSTPRSSYQVLSAKKLCASIRSGSYLGRPSSKVSVNDDDKLESETGHVTPSTMSRPVWTPAESMDESFFDAHQDDTDSEGAKRRGLKERSFLTNNSQLYKGRIARKGEGQRAGEVKVNSKGDGDSLSQRMTQIEEELGESSIYKRNNSVVSDYEQGPDTTCWAIKVTEAKHLIENEQEPDEGIHDSERSSIIDVDIDKKELLEKVQVKVNSRPNSYKSDSSYSGSTSTHTPSIITLQSIHSPQKPKVSQEKFKGLYKRRNTYCYDPDKGLVRAHNNIRRKSENNLHLKKNGTNINQIANVRHENSSVDHTANRLVNGQDFLHPDWVAYGSNSGNWSSYSNNDSDWPAEGNEPNEKSYIVDDAETRGALNEMAEHIDKAYTDMVHNDDVEDNIETAVIDQEEYVLNNIAECNAEVKQIEELADADETDHNNDGYSDSGSSMDEELIKVILTGQTEKQETKPIETVTKDDIVENGETKQKDVVEDLESLVDSDVKNTDAIDRTEQVSAISDKDEMKKEVTEEPQDQTVSRMSAGVNQDDLEVVGEKQLIPVEGGLESDRQEVIEETVDEENASEVRSYRSGRSGRKSRSKRSKSGTGSEEDDDGVSGNEFSLPTLESDRLLGQEKDDSNKEGIQTISDGQTGFSGSTASYSDILVSNPNSRPATAAHSRPASSTKLSRPTSALARPASVVKVEEVGNSADKLGADIKAESNIDYIVVAIKTDPIVNDQLEISKTDDNNKEKEKRDEIKLPVEAVVNNVEVKSSAIERKGAEVKDKDNVIKNNDRPNGARVEEKKQPVLKAGKHVNERKTVGKQVAQGRGVPPKLTKSDKKESEKYTPSKASLNKTVLEGEGLLENISEHVNKLETISGDGQMEADDDLTKVIKGHDNTDAHAIAAELDALGLRKKSKGELTYPLLKPGKRPKAPAEKAKIPDHIAEALNRQTDASIEYLEQDLERMTALVGETLSGPTLEAVGEGLTEEELELAKQILQQKLDEAKGKLDGKPSAAKTKGKKPAGKPGKKGAKKGKGKTIEEEKTQEELDREAMREKHEQEKKMREQEAAELQKKIAEKQRMLKEQNDLSSARSKELQEEMERLEREAEAIQKAEDEAREILADVRKKQREERESRRKADLERKKQEALDRREREKKEMEDKRRKEMEMMEKIADAEMRRRMKEEEERRIDEEERLAQEKYEEELREAQRLEEEEEERLKELERQAEEEAMQRLIEEREAAERERRRLREEEEALRDAENLRRQAMEEEHKRLEEERRKMQEAEDAKKEAERQRLLELRRLEQEARIKMQEEIEKRRTDALARRDFNLENRLHVDKLRHNQGLTRAWTFSYFVQWPRETYESHGRRKLERRNRPIGAGDPRKIVKINNPKPKKQVDVPPESGEAPAPAVP